MNDKDKLFMYIIWKIQVFLVFLWTNCGLVIIYKDIRHLELSNRAEIICICLMIIQYIGCSYLMSDNKNKKRRYR